MDITPKQKIIEVFDCLEKYGLSTSDKAKICCSIETTNKAYQVMVENDPETLDGFIELMSPILEIKLIEIFGVDIDKVEQVVIEKVKQLNLSPKIIMDILCTDRLIESYKYLLLHPTPTESQIRVDLKLDKLPDFQE